MKSSPSNSQIPVGANIAIAAGIVSLHLFALVVLPAAGVAPLWCGAALALVALCSPTLWGLIHEAIHGVLLPTRQANNVTGRILAIFFGAPFSAVRFGHLRHHRYNRTTLGREEVYDPQRQSRFAAYCFHFLRIAIGLYVAELALCLLCWLPRPLLRRGMHTVSPDLDDGTPGLRAIIERDILSTHGLFQIRLDAACVLALFGTALTLYGAYWPLLAGSLFVRALFTSQLDHAAHHGTPLGQREYALNLSAPRWLQCYLLSFNFHRTHHEHPNLPWSRLRDASEFQAGDISIFSAVLRQWRGPIALDELSPTLSAKLQ